MATPRRPYVTMRLNTFEEALNAGVSDRAVLLLARLLTHAEKRSTPGLLRAGVNGLAESLRLTRNRTKRDLAELESANFVLVDERERLIYVRGAIEVDAPKTENAVRGMAAQVRELPPHSPVTREVRRAIFAALSGDSDEKASAWLATWQSLAGPEPTPEPIPEPRPESGPGSGPHARGRVPIADSRDPIAEIRSRHTGRATRARDLLRSELVPSNRNAAGNGTELRIGFDAFWESYPRKAGKAAAWKWWQKRKPDAGLLATMIAALEWQRRQDNWLRDGGRFVPHPATWLNAERWLDEPSRIPHLNDRTIALMQAGEEFLK